jgi:isopenicillin N synthase-like dioxygenase
MTNLDIETERSLLSSGFGAAPATRDGDYQVPVIDMSQASAEELAKQLWDAAHSVGFFTVINHGIPLELIDQAFEVSAQFFRQSQQEKERQSPFAKELNSGYEYFTQVRPSTGTADQKESLQMTAREGAMDGRWPSSPANFKDTANELTTQAHRLAGRILDLLEKDACPLNEPGNLAQSHTLWAHDGQCTLRFLHYPPMEPETAQELTTPDSTGKIHWRAGPHTDW